MYTEVKKVYIASPFSHKYKRVMREREKEINRVIAELTYKYGFAFFGPITQSAPLERIIPALGGSFSQWENIDLTWVKTCEELWVVMLEGWDISIGVTEEIRYAQELGKVVEYIDPQNCQFVDCVRTKTRTIYQLNRREKIQRGIKI